MNNQNDIGYSARGEWLVNYLKWRAPLATKHTRRSARGAMYRFRREAALERRIEALERENNSLRRRIDSLQITIGADRLNELVTDRIGYEQ